jgi:hypothetical protein
MKGLRAIENNILNAFERIFSLIINKDIDWVLTGSMSFFIQGIETNVNDIDIQSNREGILKIKKILNDNITKAVVFSESTNIRS